MIINISNNISFSTENSVLSYSDAFPDDGYLRKYLHDKKLKDFQTSNKTITTINLIPTMMCDGACNYCYNINEINSVKTWMTPTMFDKGVSNIMKKGYEFKLSNLKLYGGEPLLNPKLSDLLIHIKATYGFDVIYISSGLLFNEKKFKNAIDELTKIVEYGIDLSIGISVDFGLTDEQFTRVSNKATINKKLLLDRCKIIEDLGIRVVYASVISSNTNISLLKKEILEHYNDKKLKFNLSDIDSTADRKFAYRVSVANSDENHPSMEQIDELYKMYNDMHDKVALTSNLYPYTDVVYSPNIIKIDDDHFLFLYESNYCGIFNDMITMLPNGDLTSCHMTPEADAFNISDEQMDYYFKNETCDACDFYNVCRGLCVNRNLQAPVAMNVYCKWAMLSFELALKRSYIINGNDDDKFKKFLEKVQVKLN